MEVQSNLLSLLGQMQRAKNIPEDVFSLGVKLYYRMQDCCQISPIVELMKSDEYTLRVLEFL